MPRVKDEYLQGKREQILDAAYRVCMQKPVYSITMRDIIDGVRELVQCYQVGIYTTSMPKDLDPHR